MGSGSGTSIQPGGEVEFDTQVGTRIGQHTAKEGKEKPERGNWERISPPCPVQEAPGPTSAMPFG